MDDISRFGEPLGNKEIADVSRFGAPAPRIKAEPFTAEKIIPEAISNVESLARGGLAGTVASIPAVAGIPGSVERFLRERYEPLGVSQKSIIPEGLTVGSIYEPVASAVKSILPRATKPTTEAGGFESIGEAIGVPVPPKAAIATAQKIGKGYEKAKDIVSKARGKPLEEALGTMKTSIEDIAKSATDISKEKEAEKIGRIPFEQAKRGVAQRSVAKQLEEGAERVRKESVTSLNKIAKPSSDYALGKDLREKVVLPNEKQLQESVKRTASVLKDAYFGEAKAKEKTGQYWSRSKTGSEFMRYLKDVMNPENAGKYNQYEIAAARDLYKDLETQFARTEFGGLKAIPSQIEKIAKVIRDTKKLPSKPTMTGADALKQQHMGLLARKLEDSVYGYVDEAGEVIEGFAPTGRIFNNVYAKMMQPLNAYESPVGQMASKRLEANKAIFTTDASELPAKIFQSPEQIKNLEQMDISKKTLQPYANQYTANELSKFNTSAEIDNWLKSNKATYLQEFPEVLKKAQDYAKTFARNESEVAGKLESAKKIIDISRRGAADVKKDLDTLRNASAEDRKFIEDGLYKVMNSKVGNEAGQARTYVLNLKQKNIIGESEANSILNKIAEVEKQAKDRVSAINTLKAILPFAGAAGLGTIGLGYAINRVIGGLNAP